MAEPKAGGGAREKRAAVRFDTRMPVQTEHGEGTTQNVSAQGVSFETDVEPRAGALVNFSIEYQLDGRKHQLLCEGKVVRVEAHGDRFRVAARLVAPLFDGIETAQPAEPR